MSPTTRAPADGGSPDPVGELRFKVEIGSLTIGMFTECTGLAVEFELMEYQAGGENGFSHKFRSRMRYPNLVLKRGVTHEAALLEWLLAVQDTAQRPTVTVSLLAPDTKYVRSWAFAGGFPVRWSGPNLSAGSVDAAVETLEIAHHGLVPSA
jgi:phage tail-like protein